jgi:gluconate 5-dehydrogenase
MSHHVFDIRGQTALVTGSSRGIGHALAQGLLEAGCAVVLHGRDPAAVDRAGEELADTAKRAGSSVHGVVFDVTDEAAVTAGVTRAQDAVGALDILVNNAGMQHRMALLDLTEDAWHRVLETNLTSAFLVGRAVARGMVARGRGKIVNVCSVQAELARPGIAPYAASKGGLKMLTKSMAAEWAISGLQVNGIGPGYFETELTRSLVEDEQFDGWVRRRTPAGRWGRREELVGALLFLASPASDFVNGQVIYVDGGISSVL